MTKRNIAGIEQTELATAAAKRLANKVCGFDSMGDPLRRGDLVKFVRGGPRMGKLYTVTGGSPPSVEIANGDERAKVLALAVKRERVQE